MEYWSVGTEDFLLRSAHPRSYGFPVVFPYALCSMPYAISPDYWLLTT